MFQWKDIYQNYILKYSNAIQKTTQPLRDHFGIRYFTYHCIDNDGKYIVLVDQPNWAEFYIREQIFLNDPYLRHPSVYQTGMSLIDSHGSKEYQEKVLNAKKNVLDTDLGTILIQKNDNFVEFFGFFANKKKSNLENLSLNYPQLLKSFGAHFKNNLASIIAQMELETNSLVELKGQDFYCDQPIHPDISSTKLRAYYQDLGKKWEIEKSEQLSLRERQCLKLLIENKTAKETAAILKLSKRTVEYYFENIKNKLVCWNKQEILQIANSMLEMGLL